MIVMSYSAEKKKNVGTMMKQPFYWNNESVYQPKNRLLKYSSSSKVSQELLDILKRLQKRYSKIPSLIYHQKNIINEQGTKRILI